MKTFPSDDDDDDNDDDEKLSPQPTTPLYMMTTVTSNTNGLILAVYADTDEEAYSFSNK